MTKQFPEDMSYCVIIDTQTGDLWKTPTGKWQWAAPVLAVLAFNFYTGLKITSMPNYKIYGANQMAEAGPH